MNSEEILKAINILTDDEKKWLNDFGSEPVLRIFMDKDELKRVKQFEKKRIDDKRKIR